MPEDGGVEEEDDDDSDSDSDDDDVKLVFTGGPQRTLDLRLVLDFRKLLTNQETATTSNVKRHRYRQVGAHGDHQRTTCCVTSPSADSHQK